MSPRDWLGSGEVSKREFAERIITEAIRRIKLEAKNDPDFVPQNDDASYLLASRQYVIPPAVPERGSDDASDLLASHVFSNAIPSTSGAGTPLNVPWALVQRDGAGSFAASIVQVIALKSTTGVSEDFAIFAPDGTTYILRVPTGTTNIELTNGSLKVQTGFGCNSKSPQTSVAAGAAAGNGSGGAGTVGGSAGATYTATEQGLINSLISTINAQASIINALATVVSDNATASNTIRTALIADGILV